MPISGTLDVSARIADAPLASDLANAPVVLERAQVLQVMFEIASSNIDDLLPPALNRTDPPVATFVVIKAVDTALGTFTLAQTRIGCRAGARPRGFVTGGYIDDMAAEPTATARADQLVEARCHHPSRPPYFSIISHVNRHRRIAVIPHYELTYHHFAI